MVGSGARGRWVLTATAVGLLAFVPFSTAAAESAPREPTQLTERAPVGECPQKDGPLPTYLPDDSDPNVFYACDKGVPYKSNCPPNLIWDQDLVTCVYE